MTKLLLILLLFVNSCEAKNSLCDWRVSCKDSIFAIDNINNSNKTKISINSNQIYINAKIKSKKDTIELFLDTPLDLGRGGLMLDWDHFSKKFPIAKLKKINESKYMLIWYGFYNEAKKKYIWKSQNTDLNIDGNKTTYILQKCCY